MPQLVSAISNCSPSEILSSRSEWNEHKHTIKWTKNKQRIVLLFLFGREFGGLSSFPPTNAARTSPDMTCQLGRSHQVVSHHFHIPNRNYDYKKKRWRFLRFSFVRNHVVLGIGPSLTSFQRTTKTWCVGWVLRWWITSIDVVHAAIPYWMLRGKFRIESTSIRYSKQISPTTKVKVFTTSHNVFDLKDLQYSVRCIWKTTKIVMYSITWWIEMFSRRTDVVVMVCRVFSDKVEGKC